MLPLWQILVVISLELMDLLLFWKLNLSQFQPLICLTAIHYFILPLSVIFILTFWRVLWQKHQLLIFRRQGLSVACLWLTLLWGVHYYQTHSMQRIIILALILPFLVCLRKLTAFYKMWFNRFLLCMRLRLNLLNIFNVYFLQGYLKWTKTWIGLLCVINWT